MKDPIERIYRDLAALEGLIARVDSLGSETQLATFTEEGTKESLIFLSTYAGALAPQGGNHE